MGHNRGLWALGVGFLRGTKCGLCFCFNLFWIEVVCNVEKYFGQGFFSLIKLKIKNYRSARGDSTLGSPDLHSHALSTGLSFYNY